MTEPREQPEPDMGFDPPGAKWINVYDKKAIYETQMDRNKPGRYRHRFPGRLGRWLEGQGPLAGGPRSGE